jgi:ABC-2 type transport system ATP-binding protein
MSEMANTADHLVVIGRGKLIADVSTTDFIAMSSSNAVRVKSPQQQQLLAALTEANTKVSEADGYLEVRGLGCAEVGDLAAAKRITIHELFEDKASLEEAFMELTRDSVEYRATAGTGIGEGTNS